MEISKRFLSGFQKLKKVWWNTEKFQNSQQEQEQQQQRSCKDLEFHSQSKTSNSKFLGYTFFVNIFRVFLLINVFT